MDAAPQETFTRAEIEALDALWRAQPEGHVWTGWSYVGMPPREISIFRTRAHWRRFPLRKRPGAYVLYDDRDRKVAEAATLEALLTAVEAIPGLSVVE